MAECTRCANDFATNGYVQLDCADNSNLAGVEKTHSMCYTPANAALFTIDATTGLVTMASGATSQLVVNTFKKNTATYDTVPILDDADGSQVGNTATVVIQVPKCRPSLSQALRAKAKSLTIEIIKDNNGVYEVMGLKDGVVNTYETTRGQNMTEGGTNFATLTQTSTETWGPYALDAASIALLPLDNA